MSASSQPRKLCTQNCVRVHSLMISRTQLGLANSVCTPLKGAYIHSLS